MRGRYNGTDMHGVQRALLWVSRIWSWLWHPEDLGCCWCHPQPPQLWGQTSSSSCACSSLLFLLLSRWVVLRDPFWWNILTRRFVPVLAVPVKQCKWQSCNFVCVFCSACYILKVVLWCLSILCGNRFFMLITDCRSVWKINFWIKLLILWSCLKIADS